MRIYARLCTVLVFCFATSAFAQTAPQDSVTYGSTPEEICKMSFETMRAEGMKGITRYIHPDELKRFQMMLWPVLEEAAADTLGDAFGMLEMFGYTSGLPDASEADAEEFMRSVLSVFDKLDPEFGESLKNMKSEILGTVTEGDSLAHVVTRNAISMYGAEIRQMEVISCKKFKDGWSLVLSGELEGLARALEMQIEG